MAQKATIFIFTPSSVAGSSDPGAIFLVLRFMNSTYTHSYFPGPGCSKGR